MEPERHLTLSRLKRPGFEAFSVFVLLFLLAVIFYSPALFGGKFLLLRDLHSQFYGARWWYREALLAGEWPHWNSYVSCGVPFLANPQHSVFYPGTLLFLFLPGAYAFALHAALHHALLGFFSWLLGRTLGLSFWGALLAAMATAFAGMPGKLTEFPEEIAGFAWTPLIFLGAWKCLQDPSPRAAGILGIGIAMQLLAGCPYPPLYSGIGILGVSLAALVQGRLKGKDARGSRLRQFGFLGWGILAGTLIGCAQYVPTLLLTQGTPRESLMALMPSMFSLRLRDVFHFVSPWLTGYPDWQKCFYLGLGPFLLVAVSALARLQPQGEKEAKPSAQHFGRAAWLFCVLIIVFGWVFAQAGYLGLDKIVAALPLVSRTMKWPTLGMTLVILGVALLAGRALDVRAESRERRALLTLALPVLVSILLAVEWLRGGVWMGSLGMWLEEEILPMASASLSAGNFSVKAEAGRLAIFAALLTAILAWQQTGKSVRWFKPAVCLALALELLTGWRGINYYAAENIYVEPPASSAWELGRTSDGELPRTVPSGRFAVPVDFITLNDLAYGSRDLREFRFLRNLLVGNTVMSLRAFTTQGLGSVPLNEYAFKLQPVLDDLAAQRTEAADRILGAWNIAVILEGDLDAQGRFHFGARRNAWTLPRARLVETVEVVSGAREALDRIARSEWSTRTVLADSEPSPLVQAAAQWVPGTDEPGTIASIAYAPNQVRVSCEVTRPCVLVLAENWARGWTARVNGKISPVQRVNFLQQAVVLLPGRNEIVFRYRTPGWEIGWASCAAGLLLLTLCFVRGGSSRRFG